MHEDYFDLDAAIEAYEEHETNLKYLEEDFE